jgi:hypothetical protein
MARTITATHVIQDPVLGPQPPVTHAVTVGEFVDDVDTVTNALVGLFRQFDLPNGGTLTVEGYGKTVKWEHDGFLVPLARKLIFG